MAAAVSPVPRALLESSYQKMASISPSLESEWASGTVLNNRVWQKRYCVTSKASSYKYHIPLPRSLGDVHS